MRSVSLLALSFALACDSQPQTPPASAPTATTSAAPADTGVAPSGKASAPARTIPPVEVVCDTDADCVVTSDELVDAPPRTYACCPGCTNHAGNKTWKAKFDAACTATPAPMCPPIGCAMPNQRPVCVAKKCALK